MDTDIVISEVRARLELPLGKNLVQSQVNSIVDRINVELGGRRALITIVSGEEIVNWEDETGDWDATTTDWDDSSLYNGFSYNTTDYILTLSDDTIKVEKIWVDDEEWQHRTYAEIKETGNSSEEWYYFAGRQIHFPADISEKTVKMQVRLNYAYITDNALTLPNNYKQLLVSGCIYMLSENDQKIAIHKEIFDKHLLNLLIQKNMIETDQDRVRNYDYQGIQYGR